MSACAAGDPGNAPALDTEYELSDRAQAMIDRHGEALKEGRLPAKVYNDEEIYQLELEHVFAENWIFAFIVAMAIRHFAIEAYRIPTASMEPMLYGDEAVSKADHVLVDKLLFRFTGPERFGVTVFLGVKLAAKGRVSLEDFERAVAATRGLKSLPHPESGRCCPTRSGARSP